jgi:zinc transporter, ZIP family
MSDFLPYLIIPAVVMLFASVLSKWVSVGERFQSLLQHLAAGIIFASIATEIVPEIMNRDHLVAMIVGYFVGIVFMYAIRGIDKAMNTGDRKGWLGVALAGGLDLVIDGFLMGIAFSISKDSGMLLTVAIAFEVLFLGLAFNATLSSRGLGNLATFVVLASMAGLLFGSSVLGYLFIGSMLEHWQVATMAFGAVALLYLITEELLVEAHQKAEPTLGPFMLFIGFGAMLVTAMVI